MLYTANKQELTYLLEINSIPNFLVVIDPNKAASTLIYASLVAY
jgi:hypothetical protein